MRSSIRVFQTGLFSFVAAEKPGDWQPCDLLLEPKLPLGATAGDFDEAVDHAFGVLSPQLYLHPEPCVLTRLAGHSPDAAARGAARQLAEHGNARLPIGVVRGHDVCDALEELLRDGADLTNTDTDEPFNRLTSPIVAANVACGAEPLVAALRNGSRVVFVGHAQPAAMARALLITQLGWPATDPRFASVDDLARYLWLGVAAEVEQHGELPLPDSQEPTGDAFKTKTTSKKKSQLPLEIVCRDGYATSALLPLNRVDVTSLAEQARRAGAEAARVEHLCYFEGESLGVVRVRVLTPTIEAAHAARRWLLGKFEFDLAEGFDFPPRVAPRFETWPTSVPAELVEWSVETRTAAEWAAD